MSAVQFPRIERTEVDGVPVFWTDVPGLVTAALQFRVGRVDEQPTKAGITHVVEHLAMGPLGQPRYDHNAFVEPLRTVFFATGTTSEITAFFATVVSSLVALPTERLTIEREVLARESESRGNSISNAHRHYRFGMSPHGLAAQQEFGLASITPEQVGGWSATAFVRGNAGLWLTGPPPADLRLTIADGPRLPLPDPQSIADVSWPAHLTPNGPGVVLGFLLPRRVGYGMFISILQRRLRQRLRLDRGIVYEVHADYEPLGASWALGLVSADCEHARKQEVVDGFFADLDSIARGDATGEELAEEVADLERGFADPTSHGGLLDFMVRDHLFGMPYLSPEERHESFRSTTAEDIAAIATEARSSALLMADVEEHPAGMTRYTPPSSRPVAGREVKPVRAHLGFGPKARLVVGRDGVMFRSNDGFEWSVRYADCVILERPNADHLIMWGRDGARLWVSGPYWRGGAQLLDEIEHAVPSDVVMRDMLSRDYLG